MPSMGTFGSFGIARMALYASSASLSVTGNNIANINTVGYCRQKVDLSAMASGGMDQFVSQGNLYFGTGVSTDSISQYRDPYMDIRFRDENTAVGEHTTKLSGLDSLAFILDEVASGEADFGIIEAQFSEIVEQLQNLSEKAGSEEYDSLVRSACDTLCSLFNSYSDKLEVVAENQLEEFYAEIKETNLLLTNIRDLNEQIQTSSIYGDPALTLRDQRNMYLDELSQKIGIDIVYTDEKVGGITVQNLTVTIAGTKTELINGNYCTQFSLPETINMPNSTYEDGTPIFDKTDAANYMYLDENGEPTNDKNLASLWLNPGFPSESDYRYLSSSGVPTNNVYQAGPQANPLYAHTEAVNIYEDPENPSEATILYTVNKPVPTDTTVDPFMEGEYAIGNWIWGEGVEWEWNEDDLAAAGYTLNTTTGLYTHTDGSTIDEGNTKFGNYYYKGDTIVEYGDTEYGDWEREADGSYKIISTTNNPYDSTIIQLKNDVEGYHDNTYMLELAPLVDKKGNIILDDYGCPKDGEILLDDVGFSGILQANRELLTEEGEYSSKLDIAMDPDATVKRGIPYYQMALDSLAQQFADMFNDMNVINPGDIFAVDSDGNFMDFSQNYLMDGDNVAVDENGNALYPPLSCYEYSFATGKWEQTNITMDNVNELARDENGDLITMTDSNGKDYYATNYDVYVYPDGVRNENFMMDENGYYLEEAYQYNENGEPVFDEEGNHLITDPLAYTPIVTNQDAIDAGLASNPVVEVEPVYLSAKNLTPERYENMLKENGISQEEYNPADMFVMKDVEGGDAVFVDSLGQTLTYDGEDITLELALENRDVMDYILANGVLTEEYSHFRKSGALFSTGSNNNTTEGITAANISISRDWSIGEVRIVIAKGESPGSSDNSNVLKMINGMDADWQYDARDVAGDAWVGKNEFFKGSFQEMLTNTVSTLAQDIQTTSVLLLNSEISALALDNARISVSGVDLNDEATNMMQYQKAYTAAAKLMTTMDQMLETLLNMK